MILISNKTECCGCSACMNICPKSAIQMLRDKKGFLYPNINKEKCNNCGLCKKRCPIQNGYHTSKNFEDIHFYAVRHKNSNVILNSQSGGAFTAISDYILENNGVVYGVGYKDHFRVAHKRAITKEIRNEFNCSKYVQSDISDTFLQVKNDLQNGFLVLFSGTPCQIAGLSAFLSNIDSENLFLCDIICYGVPSPYIWRDYLQYIEKKYNDTIIDVKFRDKSVGWSSYYETFTLKKSNKKIIRNTFNNLFFGNTMIRQSCTACIFTNYNRPSDITIGDYWGIERISPCFNSDNKGVSLVIVNTLKGKSLFNNILSQINYLETNMKDCFQPRLGSPTEISSLRSEFWKDYFRHGFVYIGKKYSDLGIKSYIIKKIEQIVSKMRK